MRVALLSGNAPRYNAIGNQIAEKVRFFQERGAEVRLFVQDARQLHPELRSRCIEVPEPTADGPVWDYLRQADLIFAVYAQYHDLLQFLPCLAGTGPRIVLDYHGVTPRDLWRDPHLEGLEQSARQRGYVWCADHALAASQASRQELLDASHFPADHVTSLPLIVDTEHFRAEPRDRSLQRQLGIRGPILLYVGRLAGNKRIPLLIEALAQLDDSSIQAAIVGDLHDVYAEEAARCQALAQQLGVAQRVHFLGQLNDAELARAYRSADLLVMPSLHEGFCVPVIEAMASGLPVIASRSAALPETVGDAGLTFVPNDVEDLVRQIRRVLGISSPPPSARAEKQPKPRGEVLRTPGILPNDRPRRVAIVSFRFGPDIVGGAETSLRKMAKALQEAGHHVEVFTTCTKSESDWHNDLPAGLVTLDGLPVHRFPIDAHDRNAHGAIVRAIIEADGHVSPEMERRYLELSIHSAALLASLGKRQEEFDAIITGPYLFGLTADIVRAFPDKTLLAPCFHDEALARLQQWPQLYGTVGGILYHSAEEQSFAQQRLGVNHPNAWEIGAQVALHEKIFCTTFHRPFVAYCGRYSEQKNVPLLVEWARRFQAEKPGRLDFVFMGQGEVKLPSEPWLHDLGRVDEATKRSVLAGARALAQLSTQESLSLVVLEAWAEGTPVIVHGGCAVLAGQLERGQGGVAVTDYPTFAAALQGLDEEAVWRERGTKGQAYVQTHYASTKLYVSRLTGAIDRLQEPMLQQMRARGLERAEQFGRGRWQKRFAEFVENLLLEPARTHCESLSIEPLRTACHAAAGARTLLLPVRLTNVGTHAAVREGPGRMVVCCEIREAATGRIVMGRAETPLPTLLVPEQQQVAALPVALPVGIGSYRVLLWTERLGAVCHTPDNRVEIPLAIEAQQAGPSASCLTTFLGAVQETLPKAHHLQQLPEDYVDVTEGRLASAKRLIKRKLLNNFKHAYVDVLSRQQSQVNGHVVLMIQQLAECCAMLDHAVSGLHQRLDGLEAKMEQWMTHGEPRAHNTQLESRNH